jgi:hypothetical protein
VNVSLPAVQARGCALPDGPEAANAPMVKVERLTGLPEASRVHHRQQISVGGEGAGPLIPRWAKGVLARLEAALRTAPRDLTNSPRERASCSADLVHSLRGGGRGMRTAFSSDASAIVGDPNSPPQGCSSAPLVEIVKSIGGAQLQSLLLGEICDGGDRSPQSSTQNLRPPAPRPHPTCKTGQWERPTRAPVRSISYAFPHVVSRSAPQ